MAPPQPLVVPHVEELLVAFTLLSPLFRVSKSCEKYTLKSVTCLQTLVRVLRNANVIREILALKRVIKYKIILSDHQVHPSPPGSSHLYPIIIS